MRGVDTMRMNPSGTVRRFAAVFAAIVLVAACAGPSPSQTPAATSPTPARTASPAATPSPTPIAWTPVQVSGLPRVATLNPTKGDASGVATDTAFTLTSLDGRAPGDLAKRLVASPPVTFVVASTSGATATLKPAKPLTAGVAYKIALQRADGSTEAMWAATAVGPLALTSTVPGNQSTSVPLDAGIEFTFNQAGVSIADLAKHVSISPVVAGRFIAAGRTIAFAPNSPLTAKTLYTVTVSAGLAAATGEPMAEDGRFSFETAGAADPTAWIRFAHPLNEATPREHAAMTVWLEMRHEDGKASRSLPVTVHRLTTLAAAERAYRAIAAFPDWTVASAAKPVATGGLTQVLSATVRIAATENGGDYIALPAALPAGWYVVTATYQGVPRQTFLQVTDAATFVLVSADKTVVWVNNLATTLPAEGATASLGGTALGATGPNGLLTAPTPEDVAIGDGAVPLLTVKYGGLTSFRPVDVQPFCAGCPSATSGQGATRTPDDYWSMLLLDRSQYQPTDTIAVYGVARLRDTGAVPAKVKLAMWLNDNAATGLVPIATATAVPDARGMFAARIPVSNLPVGDYRIRLTIGNVDFGDAWCTVSPYVKPAWRMTVTTDRHALIDGQTVAATATATFFEGTPVAGVALAMTSDDADAPPVVSATTGPDGIATATVAVPMQKDTGQVTTVGLHVRPELPEEADLEQVALVTVFRSSALVTLGTSLTATTLSINGVVNTVALNRYETPAAIADPGTVDPKGPARAGATVRVTVVEQTPYAVKTGTAYNFITKRVEPVYAYRTRTATIATRTLRTDAKGAFHLTLDTASGDHSYEISASYEDEAGRTAAESTSASRSSRVWDGWAAWLTPTDPNAHQGGYSVGDTVSVSFNGILAKPPMERYLYLVHQAGLRSVAVSDSPTFETVFTASAVPAIQLSGIRFNGAGYEAAITAYTATLRAADRLLDVQLTADKTRYQPGETATISVLARDRSGKPVAASLFVRALDEKLYAMGIASDPETFAELYRHLDSGVRGWAWSHHTPKEDGGGFGDASGGGGGGMRSDFRDFLYQGLVTTGADGRATVAIPLSDDLTSWHVSAAGVDAGLDTGTGSILLPVGLPFFVDAVLPAQLLTADKPILRVRAFGAGLKAGDAVTFTIGSDTLGMTPVTVLGTAFTAVEVPLPALTAGTQRLQITAVHDTGAAKLADAMVRTVSVVDHRVTQLRTTWVRLDAPLTLAPGASPTQLVLADAGRGRVIPVLGQLATEGSTRADTALAAELAKRVLTAQFGLDPGIPADDGVLTAFILGDSMSMVPWGGADLDAIVLAALCADPGIPPASLRTWLQDLFDAPGAPRVDRLEVLAGLAAIGEPVLDQIRAAAALTDLTPTEQVFAAVGALFAGDEALAGSLEQQLLARHGERSGALVRLNTGDGTDASVATAWLAIVAASLGDPVAADMDAWLELNPPETTVVAAQRALAARGWAMRVAGAPAVATLTVGGEVKEIRVQPGAPVAVTLTPAQAAGAVVAKVSGAILVVQTWDGALDTASLTAVPGVTISRSVSPSGTIGLTSTVSVTYDVNLGTSAPGSCWRLVDVAPSGLAPLAYTSWDPSSDNGWTGDTPSRVIGQRVEFCVGVDPKHQVHTLRYTARVVAPGTYAWEPAILQEVNNPAAGVVVSATTVTITGATP